MRRFTVGLVSTVLAVGAAIAGVNAQAMAPADVTAMLAKSHALDLRCSILAETDRQDLMDFLARAEILLAERESVKAAKTAIARGKAQGADGVCGPDQNVFVNNVLAAAKASTVAEEPVQRVIEPPVAVPKPAMQQEAQKPVVTEKPVVAQKPVTKPKEVVVADVKPAKKKAVTVAAAIVEKKTKPKPQVVAEAKPIKKNAASLTAYAGLAQRYYVELKCRNMSGASVKRLYATVLSSHKQAVSENGAGAVRSALRSAEARANASRCS